MNNVVTMLLTVLTISDGSSARTCSPVRRIRFVLTRECRAYRSHVDRQTRSRKRVARNDGDQPRRIPQVCAPSLPFHLLLTDTLYSKLQLESTESRLVEVKRKKPVPTEARKPWDDKLAKFSLKRQKMKPAAGGRRSSVDPGGDDTGMTAFFSFFFLLSFFLLLLQMSDAARSTISVACRRSTTVGGPRRTAPPPGLVGTRSLALRDANPTSSPRSQIDPLKKSAYLASNIRYYNIGTQSLTSHFSRRLSMDETALRAYAYVHPHAHAGAAYAPPSIAYRSPYVYAYPAQQGAQPAPMQAQNVPRAPPTAPYAAPQPSAAYLNQARHLVRL